MAPIIGFVLENEIFTSTNKTTHKDALIDDENIYLAVSCEIIVLNRLSLSTIGNFYVAGANVGNQLSMFEKIRAIASSPIGIWLVFHHFSCKSKRKREAFLKQFV